MVSFRPPPGRRGEDHGRGSGGSREADPTLAERLLRYSVLLRYRHGLAVRSVVVLLRPQADAAALDGRLRHALPDGDVYLKFQYRVVRVWEQPVEPVLAGSLATLPLAPLARGADADLQAVIRRMDERIAREATEEVAGQLWTATYLLMGLRYPDEVTQELLRGVRNMRESTTYQAILAEGEARGRAEGEARGRAEEARRILLRLGRMKFGMPDRHVSAAVGRIRDVDRLERLTDRVLIAASWDELLLGD